jgi:hypothetical protein
LFSSGTCKRQQKRACLHEAMMIFTSVIESDLQKLLDEKEAEDPKRATKTSLN